MKQLKEVVDEAQYVLVDFDLDLIGIWHGGPYIDVFILFDDEVKPVEALDVDSGSGEKASIEEVHERTEAFFDEVSENDDKRKPA